MQAACYSLKNLKNAKWKQRKKGIPAKQSKHTTKHHGIQRGKQ
jgi:hypothetical protein